MDLLYVAEDLIHCLTCWQKPARLSPHRVPGWLQAPAAVPAMVQMWLAPSPAPLAGLAATY